MAEEINMQEVVSEIKGATEEEIKEVVEGWFEKTRTDGLKIGAKFISVAIYDAIKKHILKKSSKPSLRDYQRMTDDIVRIISVQLAEEESKENAEHNDLPEEEKDDGTAE